jgi:tRNA threonylcarbamoyladenosine biosynthesis protein TsaE
MLPGNAWRTHPVTIQRHLPNAAATERVGMALAHGLEGGMVIALHGDLGRARPRWCAAYYASWGGPAVKSPPTHWLKYPISSLYLYHFDFCHLADQANGKQRGSPIAFEATAFVWSNGPSVWRDCCRLRISM